VIVVELGACIAISRADSNRIHESASGWAAASSTSPGPSRQVRSDNFLTELPEIRSRRLALTAESRSRKRMPSPPPCRHPTAV
jgi:hypothetical protein